MDRFHERTGYCWLEFTRHDDQGREQVCTLGCGLRALHGHQGLRSRWFFVSSARVGPDFPLKREDGTPWNRDDCKTALEGNGALYDQVEPYRRAVDDQLFQLGEHRYRSLIDLLIELRRPQLSRTLDEAHLAKALADALPPVAARILDDVAEGYRSLEEDRLGLAAAEDAHRAVRDFATTYRGYLAVQARLLADEVRETHNRYERAQGSVREAEQHIAQAEQTLADLDKQRHQLDQAEHAAIGEERALRDSDAMHSAERLARLADDCQHAEVQQAADVQAQDQAAAACERSLARQQRDHQAAQAAEAQTQAAGHQARQAAAALGAGASLDQVASPAPGLSDWDRIEADLRSRQQASRQLQVAARHCTEADNECRLAQRAMLAAETQRDQAQTRTEDADQRWQQTGAAHREAVLAHRTGLQHCHVTVVAEQLSDLVDDWIREPQGPEPYQQILAQAQAGVLADCAARRAEQQQIHATLMARQADLTAEAETLRSGGELPPDPPPWRAAAARCGQAGAPLWALCDFTDELAEESRAGLEAALHAAQLLDAWIHPDGRCTRGPDGDAVLTSQGEPVSEPLSRLLRPTPPDGCAVSTQTIATILERISTVAEGGPAWVCDDGRWGLGPLRGQWQQTSARHIGAASRAAARQARLAAIAAELDGLDQALAASQAALEDLDRIQAEAAQELASAPDGETLREAWRERQAQHRLLAEAREHLAQAQAAHHDAHQAAQAATQALHALAADCGLEDWIGRLDELGGALQAYAGHLTAWRHAQERAVLLAERLGESQRDHEAAGQVVERARQRAQTSAARLLELQHEHSTLQASQGAAVSELLARLAAVRQLREQQAQQARELTEAHGAAREARGKGEGARDQALEHLGACQDSRRLAVDRFKEVASAGLLAGLGPDWRHPLAPDSADTQVVDCARSLAKVLHDIVTDEAARSRAGTRMGEANQRLQTALSAHDYRPIIEERHGIWEVRVPFMGHDCDITELGQRLADDIAQRQNLLTAREREVIENFLIDEACEHLHQLLHEAEEWVSGVNAELASRPMSTGLSLRFRWLPDPEAPAGTAEARDRLLRPQHAWTPEDREALAGFLQRCISTARETLAGRTWQEQLALALDYRRWHRFAIERQQDGRWLRLTRRTHGTGSGGEKAIALTVPQFAAAAAHYRAAPQAPRLIMLDEAFVGIDGDMRRKCLGLLTAFDLDVIMTSEREWGCYDTVPALAIYQLAAEPGGDCVATTRYIWNGRERIQEDSATLPSASGGQTEPENGS